MGHSLPYKTQITFWSVTPDKSSGNWCWFTERNESNWQVFGVLLNKGWTALSGSWSVRRTGLSIPTVHWFSNKQRLRHNSRVCSTENSATFQPHPCRERAFAVSAAIRVGDKWGTRPKSAHALTQEVKPRYFYLHFRKQTGCPQRMVRKLKEFYFVLLK